jgi:hypothetical protein
VERDSDPHLSCSGMARCLAESIAKRAGARSA